MLDRMRLKTAADGVVAAALAGEPWNAPLAHLARAAGARDAVLMRNSETRMMTAVVTEEAADTVAAFARGNAPPNSRYARVRIGPRSGFRVDHDDYREDELARDAFYQEFLRPAGVFWHANAVLHADAGEHVELSFKRRAGHAPYTRLDAALLDGILPDLRAATRLVKHMLDAETRGMSLLLRSRGAATFDLDRKGRVLRSDEAIGQLPLHVIGRKLCAWDAQQSSAIDRAVEIAVAAEAPGLGLAPLTGPDGRRYILQIHPIKGAARDLFFAASAVAVLLERQLAPGAYRAMMPALMAAFGLTEREAEVACLRAEGFDFPAVSSLLGISQETARTYLKFCHEKIGVSRQAELVGLITRILR
jgi:DNA-binding CsgD family transcriptional regulator